MYEGRKSDSQSASQTAVGDRRRSLYSTLPLKFRYSIGSCLLFAIGDATYLCKRDKNGKYIAMRRGKTEIRGQFKPNRELQAAALAF
jgi:hypothetical protein